MSALRGDLLNRMTATDRRLELSLLPQWFAVTRLASDEPIPAWAARGSFFSITRTADELSVVSEAGNVPSGVQSEGNWRGLKVHGPFAFSEIGVLSALAGPLADAKIGVFAVSTFDTDYLFVNSEHLHGAVAALRKAGHTVQGTEF